MGKEDPSLWNRTVLTGSSRRVGPLSQGGGAAPGGPSDHASGGDAPHRRRIAVPAARHCRGRGGK
eukprot:15482277-Alexandrium_andersonii.AAC.1